jgi:hypothetical protein
MFVYSQKGPALFIYKLFIYRERDRERERERETLTYMHPWKPCTSSMYIRIQAFLHIHCALTSRLINRALERIAAIHQEPAAASISETHQWFQHLSLSPWSIQFVRGELQQRQQASAEPQQVSL